MAMVFLDTTALVRRYDRSEPCAGAVRAICAPSRGHDLLVARFVTVEVASSLGRKGREGVLSRRDVVRLWRTFQGPMLTQYQVVDLSDAVRARAEQLLFAHPLRASDAVHVGCALVAATTLSRTSLQFWIADRRQANAAGAEGLTVHLVG